ncbi:hypothetical protein [Streptomyces sp. TLI_105]|uniref:hypothetical protein n=1 Tax=Streptomyces sp. TLI_105 TaxID=1881019 RepID=UPI00089C038F|nr:hypothetical protein [Streptomyces sp. TLI_105]SED98576.1 hypothetical protein SAMN05428939_6953 [Streptomyces sp. TLI_105]
MTAFVSGVGPLFGPNFVIVTANDETGKEFRLQVYPDAHNPELRAAGLPTQYYFQPAEVFLARKHDFPDDFNFQMTVFKGLNSEEAHISPAGLAGTDLGGGFCTFSTTFGIPASVISGALEKLKQREHETPGGRIGPFFNFQQGDPPPSLGIVPITSSAVRCFVPDPAVTGGQLLMTAQHAGKGSIEAQGLCSFLLSCNLPAAGAIASALKQGVSPPFVVENALQESFYINGLTVEIDVDIDKVYDSFSAAVSAGGLFRINSINAEFAYQNCLTTGGIVTHMTMNNAVPMDPSLKKWVDENVDMMKKNAIDLVKSQIFDFDPAKTDSKAAADRGWFSELFGGSAVSVKSTHAHNGVHVKHTLVIDQTVTVDQTVSGNLNDLPSAVRDHLNKYLFVVDIGEFFKKVQVVGSCRVNFIEKLDDGTELKDPLQAVQLEAGYPDFSSPMEDGHVNLTMRTSGKHYVPGETEPTGPDRPAIWDEKTARDFVNISFLRLDTPVDGWPSDQVRLRKTLIFDGQDPRVNLSERIAPDDPAIAVVQEDDDVHAPILTASVVGYVFVRFKVEAFPLPPNITLQITPTIGQDTYAPLVLTSKNDMNVLWEVYSDKYGDETEFTYTVNVRVRGPRFFDPPVVFSTAEPVRVPLRRGLIKYIPSLVVPIPEPPANQVETIDRYVLAAMTTHA